MNPVSEMQAEPTWKLCENMDCVRYPPDWDAKRDTEETYQEDPWLKCNQCDGYYNNDGGGDILYVQEEPNNQEAECDLCGKTKDIVQMKGTGQYLCGNACDESDEEEEEEEEEEEGKRKCETCAIHINTDDIIELSIEVNGHNLKLCLCENCFQDKADTLRKEGWNVDDLFEEKKKKEEEDRFVLCEECDLHIDCNKDNIHIIYKGEQYNPSEEIVLCTACFQDNEEDLRQQDYKCDEWEEEDE